MTWIVNMNINVDEFEDKSPVYGISEIIFKNPANELGLDLCSNNDLKGKFNCNSIRTKQMENRRCQIF
jgi:hypothetical protein